MLRRSDRHTRKIALLFALSVACWVFAAPTITSLDITPDPSGRTPLAALCVITTDTPTRLTLVVQDEDETRRINIERDYGTEHHVPLLGLRPGRSHRLDIIARDEAGAETTTEPFELIIPSLPDELPPVDLRMSRPSKMEPGVTLIPLVRWPQNGGPDRTFGLILGVDAHGEVVWYYRAPHNIAAVKRLRNGHLLYHYGRLGNVVEINMLGQVVRQWHTTGLPKPVAEGSIPVDAETIHHDVQELPSGNLLAISTEVRRLDDYPSSETDPDAPPETANVIGDVLVEFDEDGTVIRKHSLLDILDPYRICYDSLDTGFWKDIYTDLPGGDGKDWSHANSVFFDENDGSVLVSIYHQDAVIKFDWETGALHWIISLPSGWREPWQGHLLWPLGEGLYPCHEHAAKVTPQGTILMYDNGTYRARPFQGKTPPRESFSRVVEYRTNVEAMQFAQVWSYGGPEDEIFFSPILGDADWLPQTGNILVTDGGRIRTPQGGQGGHPKHGREWAHIFEVTRMQPAEKVFDIEIDDPRMGWTVYRAERLPSLYPDWWQARITVSRP
jgi:arylsulfate sulfotransferase